MENPRNSSEIPLINDLHISDPPIADVLSGSNPWQDQTAKEQDKQPEHRLKTPDPSALDEFFIPPISGPPQDTNVHVNEQVLNEFDPLAHQEEKAARDAWAVSESHPPSQLPPPRPVPVPSESEPLPPRTGTPSPSGPAFVFPSLAALARTFSIPTPPRARPVSLDTAKSVPSPAILSAFASQQRVSDSGSSDGGSGSAPGSGANSPRPGAGKVKEVPFDFQRFLDQMKLKGAEPVAKYLRSFLGNFAKRTFTVNDQVRIINDFLNFISVRMRETDIWRNATEAEFDNAMEGMEKLVMNRLYEFTFTPQAARSIPPRPITADDLERDRVLSQRIALFVWIEEKHLDIPEGEGGKGFLMFAQQELLKINHYKAPRDKLICVLNCCKVIFGLIRHLKKDEGADSFVPILIFVVLKANPEHLLSNVEFINRFRNPVKLQSEAGYYLSSLMGAVSFIETMDHTSLSNITQVEFEKNVEDAINSLPPSEPASPLISAAPSTPARPARASPGPSTLTPHAGEESAQPLALPAPGPSDNARRLLQKTGDTISKPLNAIGRIFSEALDGAEETLTYLPGPFMPFEMGRETRHERGQSLPESGRHQTGLMPQTPIAIGEGAQQIGPYAAAPIQTPYKQRVRRPSPSGSFQLSPENTPTRYGSSSPGPGPFTNQPLAIGPSQALHPPRVQTLQGGSSPSSSPHVSRTPTPNLDLTGLQEEIDQAHDRAAEAARETLIQIFPSTDVEVVEWVLEANAGDLGKSIEALLEMSSGT